MSFSVSCNTIMQHRLYSFGFNAFEQAKKSSDTIVRLSYCHTHTSKVLFTSWETTIVIDGKLIVKKAQFVFEDLNGIYR